MGLKTTAITPYIARKRLWKRISRICTFDFKSKWTHMVPPAHKFIFSFCALLYIFSTMLCSLWSLDNFTMIIYMVKGNKTEFLHLYESSASLTHTFVCVHTQMHTRTRTHIHTPTKTCNLVSSFLHQPKGQQNTWEWIFKYSTILRAKWVSVCRRIYLKNTVVAAPSPSILFPHDLHWHSVTDCRAIIFYKKKARQFINWTNFLISEFEDEFVKMIFI